MAASAGKLRHTLMDWRAAARVARRLPCWITSISSRDSASRSSASRIPPALRNVRGRYVVMTQIVVTTGFRRNRREYQNQAVAGEGFSSLGVRGRSDADAEDATPVVIVARAGDVDID